MGSASSLPPRRLDSIRHALRFLLRALFSFGQRQREVRVGLRAHEHVLRALVVAVLNEALGLRDSFLGELQVERRLGESLAFAPTAAPAADSVSAI